MNRPVAALALLALLSGSAPPESHYREMRREFLPGLEGVHVAVFASALESPGADGRDVLRNTIERELEKAGVSVFGTAEAEGKPGVAFLSAVIEGLDREEGLFVGQVSLRVSEAAVLVRTGQRVSAETWAEGLTLAAKRDELPGIAGRELVEMAREFAEDYRKASAKVISLR